jgi:hypothetical protein
MRMNGFGQYLAAANNSLKGRRPQAAAPLTPTLGKWLRPSQVAESNQKHTQVKNENK